MERRRCAALTMAAVTLLGLAPGCRSSSQGQREQPAGSLRIVSLAPSVTETLFAMGLGDWLVGATEHCDYPPAARQIPRVGGFGRPSVEALLAAKPDLVIASGLEPGAAVASLQKLKVRLLDVKIRNFAEVFDAIRQIGQATGQQQAADRLIARMQADLDGVAARVRDIPADQRPRVFVELWADPLGTAGGGSFIDEVIRQAGGVNVAGQLAQPYPKISPEKVIEWNPDVIIVCHMSRAGAAADTLARRIGWADIAAVRNDRVVGDFPNDLLLRPGPRLTEAVKLLADRLHGPAGAGSGPE